MKASRKVIYTPVTAQTGRSFIATITLGRHMFKNQELVNRRLKRLKIIGNRKTGQRERVPQRCTRKETAL